MVELDAIQEIIANYDKKNINIATIGSHSALNIFKGAKDENFKTLCLCEEKRKATYDHFPIIDEYIMLNQMKDILKTDIQEKLRFKNSIIIPHGSFNAYVGSENIEESFEVPIFGNRALLTWESHREMQNEWLKKAGVSVPKTFNSPEDINTLTITKFPRAKGGRGYFISNNKKIYDLKAKEMLKRGLITDDDLKEPQIQEYILGSTMYLHYFYSPLKDKVEFLGADRRYESNVDGVSRVPAKDQIEAEVEPTYTVVGNFLIVLRESLLTQVFDIGRKVVEASKKIAPPGLIGPFCLETVCNENLKFTIFEISSRIVAGCNVCIGYSPYTYVEFGEPMYMGRRIAREIRNGINQEKLNSLVT